MHIECKKMIDTILKLLFIRPIALADYSQRQQEDLYFWIHENIK
jgi:hypothetical protein